ncbi:hypothetical protein AB3X24_02760, partial [Klebsiella variicola]
MSNMIAVTMGDPAGIGPEIIIKSLAEGALSGAPVVVVGCAQTLRRILALNITPRAELRIIDHPAEASFSPATINVIDEPLSDPQGLRPGEVQAQAGDLAFRCIRRATALALDGGGGGGRPPAPPQKSGRGGGRAGGAAAPPPGGPAPGPP